MIYTDQRAAAALCWVALGAALAGLCFALAGGDADRGLVLDHASTVAGYHRAAENASLPLPIYLQSYNQFFPDLGLTLLMSAVFGSPFLAIYVFAVLCLLVATVGNALLVRRLWQNPALTALAPLMSALMILPLFHGDSDELFATQIAALFRTGLLALQPLLLLWTLNVLFAPGRRRMLAFAALLLVALFFLRVSFYIVVVWFAVPAALALMALLLKKLPRVHSHWPVFVAVVAAAFLLAHWLHDPLIKIFVADVGLRDNQGALDFSLTYIMLSLELLWIWLAAVVARSPLLAAVWIAFIALLLVAAWQRWQSIPSALSPSAQNPSTKEEAKKRRWLFKKCARFYAAMFVLSAIVIPIAVAVITGKFGLWGRAEHFANHRYFSPSVYWPLFWGWPLLLGFFTSDSNFRKKFSRLAEKIKQALRLRGRFGVVACFLLKQLSPEKATMAAAALLIALSLPSFRHAPEVGRLASYHSPFLQCAQENAEKFGLRQGIANDDFALYLSALGETSAGPMRALGVVNNAEAAAILRKPIPPGQKHLAIYPKWVPPGMSADNFNYVVVNRTDEAKLLKPPEVARCPRRLQRPGQCYDEPPWAWAEYHFIDAAAVVADYGPPVRGFRCEGVDFLVYDRPLAPPPVYNL